MNLSDIVDDVNRDIGEPQAFHSILSLVNRALDELTPVARIEQKKTTDVVESNLYALPDDLHQIQHVMIGDQTFNLIEQPEQGYTGYQQWGNEFEIVNGPDIGTVELYYYKKLTRLAANEDIPEIEPEFHDLLILYAKGHLTQDRKQREEILTQYENRKQQYVMYKTKQKRRRSVRITMNW